MSLISLVYVSYAAHDMSDVELQAILQEARDNNVKHDISGMLLYRDRYFIQALEGEATVVEPLYEGIKHDPRHTNVLTVSRTPIEKRSFPQWSMGFNKVNVSDVNGFTDFMDRPFDHDYFSQNPNKATLLLEQFRDRTFF